MSINYKLIFLLILVPNFISAQLKSGITLGLNQSYSKNSELFNYEEKTGFCIGYTQSFKIYHNWNLSLGTNFSNHHLMLKPNKTLENINPSFMSSKKSITYINIPIAVNYLINKIFLFTGYQYSHSIANNTLLSNSNNHSLLSGIGYNSKHIVLSFNFSKTINQEQNNVGYVDFNPAYNPTSEYIGIYPKKASKLNVLQITAIIPLKLK
ncbi:outer membrane beta-barrel protein [Plebeiibacterium sediminum]|uniref:PorT family protein n=1 Tax=Plebeiibacterium sediminum TaxID=2992112 RepID=A0AAE3SGS7_9BACT|nr:outer membrane beta-barrel protein [Plebeiobacterium sediminum]MCW3788805.1 PorT family protein [Plebeiobacterium sediminum]